MIQKFTDAIPEETRLTTVGYLKHNLICFWEAEIYGWISGNYRAEMFEEINLMDWLQQPRSDEIRINALAYRFDCAYDCDLSHYIGDVICFHADSFKALDPSKYRRRSSLLELADFADFFLRQQLLQAQRSKSS